METCTCEACCNVPPTAIQKYKNVPRLIAAHIEAKARLFDISSDAYTTNM